MKTKPFALTALLTLALTACSPAADPPATPAVAAAQGPRYEALPTGSEMRIDGDSTIHKWNAISKILSGAFEVEPAWKSDLTLKSVTCLGAGKSPKATVRIPVRTLKSSSGTKMDSIMLQAMKATNYAAIDYRLTEMIVNGNVPASGSPVKFDTKGELTVAGVTNKVSFPITMERVGADGLKFAGSLKMKMTSYDIKPPVLSIFGIGAIKTDDDITLTWTWNTALKP